MKGNINGNTTESKVYHVVLCDDNQYTCDPEFELLVTADIGKAICRAKDESYYIVRDKRKNERVEIRIYEDEEMMLDYDTLDF